MFMFLCWFSILAIILGGGGGGASPPRGDSLPWGGCVYPSWLLIYSPEPCECTPNKNYLSETTTPPDLDSFDSDYFVAFYVDYFVVLYLDSFV